MKTVFNLPVFCQYWVCRPLVFSGMEKIKLTFFYGFGASLYPLTIAKPSPSNRADMIWYAENVKVLIDHLFHDLADRLNVCVDASKELLTQIDLCLAWNSEPNRKDDGATNTLFSTLVTKAKEFETILLAEVDTLESYQVTRKCIYSTIDLIEHAENIFDKSVREKLTDKIKSEIREGGKCFAFDSPTASGFHMLRATELVLHRYYLAICKPQSDKPLDNWGAYISALHKWNQINDDSKVKRVLVLLQLVKDDDRNYIMHAEDTLTIEQAFTLFETSKTAIIAMAEKLEKVCDE